MTNEICLSRYFTKEQLLEVLENWEEGDVTEKGRPVWYYMGWTKEEYAQWVRDRTPELP